MSRNWTPKETYLVDKFENHAISSRTISFTINGKTSIMYDPNCEMAKAFPHLYFLGGDIFEQIKRLLPITFVADVEIVLTGIIEIVDSLKDPFISISDNVLLEKMKPEYYNLSLLVRDWFEGKLDPNFYYCEYNHECFLEKLTDLYNAKNKERKENE